MKIKNEKDFFAGLMFMGVGLAFTYGGVSYGMGEASRMGPGYFPVLLGSLMMIMGVAITCKALVIKTKDENKIGRWVLKPIVFILAANFLFGIFLCGLPLIKMPSMGLIVAIYALTIVSSLASERFRLSHVVILSTILAVGCYLTFIVLLKLPLPAWPAFIY